MTSPRLHSESGANQGQEDWPKSLDLRKVLGRSLKTTHLGKTSSRPWPNSQHLWYREERSWVTGPHPPKSFLLAASLHVGDLKKMADTLLHLSLLLLHPFKHYQDLVHLVLWTGKEPSDASVESSLKLLLCGAYWSSLPALHDWISSIFTRVGEPQDHCYPCLCLELQRKQRTLPLTILLPGKTLSHPPWSLTERDTMQTSGHQQELHSHSGVGG